MNSGSELMWTRYRAMCVCVCVYASVCICICVYVQQWLCCLHLAHCCAVVYPMYVCMYCSRYVCLFVCMYACMYTVSLSRTHTFACIYLTDMWYRQCQKVITRINPSISWISRCSSFSLEILEISRGFAQTDCTNSIIASVKAKNSFKISVGKVGIFAIKFRIDWMFLFSSNFTVICSPNSHRLKTEIWCVIPVGISKV